jgi:hypothetical protein
VIYQNIYGFTLVKFINTILNSDIIKINQVFPDINRGWYAKIGSKIILPIIFAIFSPHTLKFIFIVIRDKWHRRKALRAKNQKKYIQLRTPDIFLLETRYAKMLTGLFVILTYSTGMPILIFFYFITLLVMFWVDKILCLRYSGKPPLYSEDLILSIAKAIPAALIIHMAFGIYIYSNEEIFPFSITFNTFYKQFSSWITTNEFFTEIIRKCYKCLPFFIEMVLFFAVFLFEDLVELIINRIKASNKNKVFTHEHEIASYTNNYKKIAYFSLPNYNIALNPKYRELLKMMLVQFKTFKDFAKPPSMVIPENTAGRKSKVNPLPMEPIMEFSAMHEAPLNNTLQIDKDEVDDQI